MKKVVTIPQKNSSYNVLVPKEIQGKECKIIKLAQRPTATSGSVGHTIQVNGKYFNVPVWAVQSF